MGSTMVMTPNLKDYYKIINILRDIKWTPQGGWCNCNMYSWTGLTSWDFHGGNSDQGILFHYYYIIEKSFKYLNDGHMKYVANAVHLNVGEFKPWKFSASNPQHYRKDIDVGMLELGNTWIEQFKNFANKFQDDEDYKGLLNKCMHKFQDAFNRHNNFRNYVNNSTVNV